MESMSMEPQDSNDSCYMSAPVSPGRISMESLGFFSLPTSPRRTLDAAQGLQTEPTTPKTWDGYSSSDDDFHEFEFETSRRFNVDDDFEVESKPKSECQSEDIDIPDKNHSYKASLPAMAFADELFADGKVMPLKPPPRLQYPNDNKFDKQSSPLSSPRSQTGVLKLPFQRRTLWNDDFDPFMVALRNVKEEKYHRRSRSMSPFRNISLNRTNELSGSSQQQINEMGLILPTKQSETNSNKKTVAESNESALVMWLPDQNMQMGRREQVKQVEESPIKLAEPKGVVFARRARLFKVGHEKPKKHNMIALEAGVIAKENGITCTKETKSQRFKNFLSRTASMRITSKESKPQSSNATESRPKLTKKFSFKSIGLRPYNEEKRVSQVTRMTLIQYRPKLLPCMGYGSKYVQ